MFPKLEINIKKLKENANILVNECEPVQVGLVTKSFCAIPQIVESLCDTGISFLADSRISNLMKLQHLNLPKVLLRIPMMSEVKELVNYVDISFNSELEVIKKINEEAQKINKVQQIVLMFDLGDLREGFFDECELIEAIEEIIKLKNIKMIGIGTNLTCYGAIIPSKENLSKLIDIANDIKEKFNLDLSFVSGGNSSSLHLIDKNELPSGISNLRLGEAIVLGKETAYGKSIKGTHEDVFTLICEIIELKNKPSLPIGEIGVDAFGKKPHYEDKGIRKRAILAIGKQDVNVDCIIPLDANISILGASSDHLILDVTDSEKEYKIGDTVEFNVQYGSLLSLCTSEYVKKVII